MATNADTYAKPEPKFECRDCYEFRPRQIMPADGWYAVLNKSDGEMFYERLAAWACGEKEVTTYSRPAGSKEHSKITDEFKEASVWGLIAGPSTTLSPVEELPNFEGYVHESELPEGATK